MRRAVERFNASEEPRKVAGLIRSLGEPQAARSPRPAAPAGAGDRRLGALLVPVGGGRDNGGRRVGARGGQGRRGLGADRGGSRPGTRRGRGREASASARQAPQATASRRGRPGSLSAAGWWSTSTAGRGATPARRRSRRWSPTPDGERGRGALGDDRPGDQQRGRVPGAPAWASSARGRWAPTRSSWSATPSWSCARSAASTGSRTPRCGSCTAAFARRSRGFDHWSIRHVRREDNERRRPARQRGARRGP